MVFRFFLVLLLFAKVSQAQPISLHTENPHYLSYKGKPILLITSAEHYGAVLNLDFDYDTYLETLQKEGMNYTRIFVGSYVEIPGSFGIEKNTLAPKEGKFIAPWKRTEEVGLFEGEKKFDLKKWNEAYFTRLKDFIAKASEKDIIVEVTFFCSTYQDSYWERNPFNPGNNVNNITNTDRKKSNTLQNENLTNYQKALVNKIVLELNEFDNIFYEVQNEPWADDPQKALLTLKTLSPKDLNWAKQSETASKASLAWQKEIADVVYNTETNLPKTHLIAQNYTNFKHSLPRVESNISIINFHYAWPEAVWMNYPYNKPISFDESGFAGSSDTTYLQQAWQFMLAGGAIFNNLDYSFYVGAEDGKGKNNAPGGGSTTFRKQLTYLHRFLTSFDFIEMRPDFGTVYHAPGVETQTLSKKGEQYAICITGPQGDSIKLRLPTGKYTYAFLNPFNGMEIKKGEIMTKESITTIELPSFDTMLGLKIVAENK
ncbi:MAG: hypothetical protein AAGI07_17200 [Bacteroidota bacterium]